MKAVFEQITPREELSFLVKQFSLHGFEGPYHFHPELELTFIEQSSGKRYIGGTVSDYTPGDMVLLGADVPHCWHSSRVSNNEGDARAIVIQFRESLVKDRLLELPEFLAIRKLLDNVKAGILIHGTTREVVAEKMKICMGSDGFHKFIFLLEILQCIAISLDTEPIDDRFPALAGTPMQTQRYQRVFSYLIEHYRKDISLGTMASVACLTPTAFCRYFRKITHRTLTEVITEYRLKHACELLRNTEKPVAEISFESGFGNISHFNKTFRNLVGNTPLNYRKLFFK